MRSCYVVTYDISDPKRLRKVFDVLQGWGDHLQFSVFRCELNAREVVELRERLVAEIHARKDQVLLIDIGPADGRARDCVAALGRRYEPAHRGAVVL